jgi:hypothetical protein
MFGALHGITPVPRTRSLAATLFLCVVLGNIFSLVSANASEPLQGVSPSQVLVLYNADWKDHHPLLDAYQESMAVAEHYVRMHTDPISGEKPYMLGLTGKRFLGSLLVDDHLKEESNDNGCGVVYQPPDSGKPVSAGEMRDSRLVEVVLPKSDIPWDTHSLRLELESGLKSDQGNVLLVDNGVSLHPDKVMVQHQGEWQIRAIGKQFLTGPFTAKAQCADAQGKLHSWSAPYHDIEYASCSATGPDGVRDDQNYLDCVEKPIKTFLEDPANARPDGTLLKDHILYFVVCFGLPRTVAAPFGIATGITDQLHDFGSHIDFGQRLQIMYYDLEQLHRDQVRPMRLDQREPAGQEAFRRYVFRNPLSRPLLGGDINPFVHPKAYYKDKGLAEPVPFTSAQRSLRSDRHLFFTMRVDGTGSLEAMELVDRAVYASSFAGSKMGVLPGVALDEDSARTGEMGLQSSGRVLWDLGYRHLFQHPQGAVRLEFLRLLPGTGFFNAGSAFLPGGIATYVKSDQGWNVKDSRFCEYLRQGVTVTAGSARVDPRVTPHIHNHSFWDEDVLYPLLLKGRPMGEILLANQIHLNWITSFVGDPLYRLPADPQRPPALPGLTWKNHVRVKTTRDAQQGKGYLVMVDLEASASEPRVAQMRLTPAQKGEGAASEFRFERFSSRPVVFVPKKEVLNSKVWKMELMDPFGQRIELEGPLE